MIGRSCRRLPTPSLLLNRRRHPLTHPTLNPVPRPPPTHHQFIRSNQTTTRSPLIYHLINHHPSHRRRLPSPPTTSPAHSHPRSPESTHHAQTSLISIPRPTTSHSSHPPISATNRRPTQPITVTDSDTLSLPSDQPQPPNRRHQITSCHFTNPRPNLQNHLNPDDDDDDDERPPNPSLNQNAPPRLSPSLTSPKLLTSHLFTRLKSSSMNHQNPPTSTNLPQQRRRRSTDPTTLRHDDDVHHTPPPHNRHQITFTIILHHPSTVAPPTKHDDHSPAFFSGHMPR